ncbi:glycine cleavage system aminomethyltransferase GcvT [Enterococcus sp. LJL90]
MPKHTPLYEEHKKAAGKMVEFAGYELPVQYPTGVIKEHLAVRETAGLFDVSHMGEVIFEGTDALANLQQLLTNDFSTLAIGKVRYTLMCNYDGGVLDDLLVYRLNEDKFLIVLNAANREKDVAWMESHLFGDVTFADISDEVAQVALQGPVAKEILSQLTASENLPEKYYSFKEGILLAGVSCLISQTGYTGSFGYEIYCQASDAPKLWQAILQAGAEFALIPAGLAARDTLRLEAAMPLYGHEMDETITPFEADLGFGVNLAKADFIGKQALTGKEKPEKTRVGLEVVGKGIAREHVEIFAKDGQPIGQTTSGTMSPYLKKAIAMASIDRNFAESGTEIELQIRNKRVPAVIVPLPFYKRPK